MTHGKKIKLCLLDLLTMHHVNTEILKENQNIRNELKELTFITEAWLNSSNKVNHCISKQIPIQKKKILRIDQLTENTSSSGSNDPVFIKSSADNSKVSITDSNKPKLSLAEDSTLSNHDTGKVLSNESQRNTTDHLVVISYSSVTDYDLADESLVCSTPLPSLEKLTGAEHVFGPKTIKSILKSKSTFKAETLKGITINEPSSAPARGNKHSSTSKTNSAPAGKLKNVKIEDDPPLDIVMKELNELKLKFSKNSSSYFRNKNSQLDFQDSPDDEEDTRSNHEYLNDLEEEYQAITLLAKSKWFFKKERVSVGKESTNNGEWVKISIQKEAWLNSSNKVNHCISKQIPIQKKKILRIDQLTENTSSSGSNDPVFIKSSADNSETIKSILKSKSTFKAETLKGITINEPSSAPARGNKRSSASKTNSAPAGIDYDKTFAPITRLEAIRIFLAFATYINFIVYQMDVKSAFLNGKLKEEVYVKQPLGFESNEFPNHVCKLDKALYGIKQAPRAWYETLSTFLTNTSLLGIQFLTCLCARYQGDPKESHLIVVKRIFRYLKGKAPQKINIYVWSALIARFPTIANILPRGVNIGLGARGVEVRLTVVIFGIVPIEDGDDDDDDYDKESIISTNTDIFKTPPSIVIITSPLVLPIEDPEVSLIMGNEELNTIPEKESDEFIKFSVGDLVPIPSESEDTSGSDSECILPSCDDFSSIDILEEKVVTFFNPLFNSNDDFTSSGDESLSDEDVPEDNVKIYSIPLFEFNDEYISSDINPLFDEVLENIESKDSYDSNLDESNLLITPLSDANKNECFDSGGDDDEINVLDCEDSYYDSEGDILYLESLLNDDLVRHDPSIPAISVASILEGFTDEPPLKENDELFDLEPKNDD
nr:retrovirus-related Pol polyprotein from transposon TNT 1-94 [Tanacetum cinerariifolium]